ncbi:hypothetical protein HID58_009983 [Brassica napus]|uniref:Uncharacterized protein n=1 Tax=Brassica napus TaxID=3708 RepID=A0ABQ8DU24_BRANA|nr:hypothetical protein HID58_009983 [Brassica napus]
MSRRKPTEEPPSSTLPVAPHHRSRIFTTGQRRRRGVRETTTESISTKLRRGRKRRDREGERKDREGRDSRRRRQRIRRSRHRLKTAQAD